MEKLKEWLQHEIDYYERQLFLDRNALSGFESEYGYTKRAYQLVLDKINELNPTFCATCGKQTNGEKFCSKECSKYEDLE